MKELNINDCNLKLYNDDCFKILKTIKDDSIDCAIIDSPYNIGLKNGHVTKEENWDKRTTEEYIEFSSEWLKEVYRILKPTGTCWTFFGRTKIKEWFKIVENTEFTNHLQNWITYARSKGRASKNKLKSLAEEIWMLTKSKQYIWNSESYMRKVIAPYRNAGGEKRGWDYGKDGITPTRSTGLGNVIPIFTAFEEVGQEERRGIVLDIGTGQRLPLSGDIYNLQFPIVPSVNNKLERQIHSAQKSILLLSMLILLSSNENDIILDCFGGSFSTGAASAICGRNFIGIEKEKETYNKGIDFIKNLDYDRWEHYIKNHITTTESNSKFKFGPRQFYKEN